MGKRIHVSRILYRLIINLRQKNSFKRNAYNEMDESIKGKFLHNLEFVGWIPVSRQILFNIQIYFKIN